MSPTVDRSRDGSTPMVCLVVPARNASATLGECLTAAASNLRQVEAAFEMIVVDDGSVDETASIASRLGARVLDAGGRGPGGARNLGWHSTAATMIWFLDSDCVPEAGCLERLVDRLTFDPTLAGAGGSYSNLRPDSLLARVIHGEIVARHRRMGSETDHLGSYHVLYRRTALHDAGGFDEKHYNGPGRAAAEDLELSIRMRARGERLGFVMASRVGHHHPTSLRRYLRAQAVHGFYATRVFLRLPQQRGSTRYSGWIDHVQPCLAVITTVAAATATIWPPARIGLALGMTGLVLLALPMAARLLRGDMVAAVGYLLLSPFRAVVRGAGLVAAVASEVTLGKRR